LLQQALAAETHTNLFDGVEVEDHWEMALSAQGLMQAARLLDQRYHLVITNVPYLARGKQEQVLKDYCELHYSIAKNDLANVFLERCLELSVKGCGSVQIVMPQNWLFLGSYKGQRERRLRESTWNLIALLGAKGFQTPMWDFNIQLLTISSSYPTNSNYFYGLNVSDAPNAVEKAHLLVSADVLSVHQFGQLSQVDSRISLKSISATSLLSDYANTHQGLATGDLPRFGVNFWEVHGFDKAWIPWQGTVSETVEFGGRSSSELAPVGRTS
jgi:hypothetical protein